MVTVLEAATRARITKQKVRYWLELLEIEPSKKEGKLYIHAAAVDLLVSMKKAISSGIAPAVAAVEIKNIHALPVESPAPICAQDDEKSAARITELEKAILLLAESNQGIIKQNQDLIVHVKTLAAIINKQSIKLNRISARLPEPPKVEACQPKKAVAKVPLLKRLWLELFDPIQLRATP